MIDPRQYANNQRLGFGRPPRVRGVRYVEETSELQWEPPIEGNPFSHILIRFAGEGARPAVSLPRDSRRLLIPRTAKVEVSTFNDISNIESDRVSISVNNGIWEDATSSTFGPILAWDLYYDLNDIDANLVITTTVTAARNRRLLIWVLQHASTLHGISFDSAVFGNSASKHCDAGMMLVMEFAGRFGSSKWWPITLDVQIDPTA